MDILEASCSKCGKPVSVHVIAKRSGEPVIVFEHNDVSRGWGQPVCPKWQPLSKSANLPTNGCLERHGTAVFLSCPKGRELIAAVSQDGQPPGDS